MLKKGHDDKRTHAQSKGMTSITLCTISSAGTGAADCMGGSAQVGKVTAPTPATQPKGQTHERERPTADDRRGLVQHQARPRCFGSFARCIGACISAANEFRRSEISSSMGVRTTSASSRRHCSKSKLRTFADPWRRSAGDRGVDASSDGAVAAPESGAGGRGVGCSTSGIASGSSSARGDGEDGALKPADLINTSAAAFTAESAWTACLSRESIHACAVGTSRAISIARSRIWRVEPVGGQGSDQPAGRSRGRRTRAARSTRRCLMRCTAAGLLIQGDGMSGPLLCFGLCRFRHGRAMQGGSGVNIHSIEGLGARRLDVHHSRARNAVASPVTHRRHPNFKETCRVGRPSDRIDDLCCMVVHAAYISPSKHHVQAQANK